MQKMEFDQFSKLAKTYRTVPVYQMVLADLLTPFPPLCAYHNIRTTHFFWNL